MWSMCRISGILTFISTLTVSSAIFTGGRDENIEGQNFQGTSKGWLRVCNDNPNGENLRHYEVEAEKCPHGAWFSERLKSGCVCLNGLWAISQSWCDEDYFVAYGKGDCFRLEWPIQKLAFLGNAEDAFETKNFITKENGHVFRGFSNEFVMPYEFSRHTNRTLLRLRPNRRTGVLLKVKSDMTWNDEFMRMTLPVQDMMINQDQDEEPICIGGNNKWTENELLIYKVKTGIKYIKVTEQCQQHVYNDKELDEEIVDVTVFKVWPGQAIHVKSGSIIQATRNCSSTCLAKDHHAASHAQTATTQTPIRHKRQALEALKLDREFTPEERDEIVRTANLRVVKQELNWLLEGIRPPGLNSANWKLAQKMKEVFVKACPDTAAPKFLVNSMMRLFRLFYLNSRDFYPNGHMLEEKAMNERMANTLNLCLTDATPLEFKYEVIKEDSAKCREIPDENDVKKTVTVCTCSEVLGYVNMTYSMNLTGPAGPHIVIGKDLEMAENLVFIIPKENQFDADIHDYPTETLWKVVTFTHFYCAKYFHHNPADLSALMTKMEDFFNEDIMYRWVKPGQATFTIWQYLYSAFDLKKFAKSVDACVAASKYVSEYPEWLNRPTIDIKRRRKRSLDNAKLWKGSAYCLDDPWDPVYKLGIPVPDKCVDLNRY